MHRLMEDQRGVGIACPQIGSSVRMFVLKNPKSYSFRDAYVCINPKVVQTSDHMIEAEEGCLSFPTDTCKISRPIGAVVSYTDLKGQEQNQFFFGALARAFLHELDHLDGITMHDRVGK